MKKLLIIIPLLICKFNCLGQINSRYKSSLNSSIRQSDLVLFKARLEGLKNISQSDLQELDSLATKIAYKRYCNLEKAYALQQNTQSISENNITLGLFSGVAAVGAMGSASGIIMISAAADIFIAGTLAAIFSPIAIIGFIGVASTITYKKYSVKKMIDINSLTLLNNNALAILELIKSPVSI